MKQTEWKYKVINPYRIEALEKKKIPTILAKILAARNIDVEQAVNVIYNAESFLDFYSGSRSLINCEQAAEKIIKYLNNNTKIWIFADYDTDGLTSGSIAHRFLVYVKDILKVDTEIYTKYPQRKDGYGLSIEFCKNLIEETNCDKKETLVITVDNGVTKHDEIELLRQNGIEVVVTDHHMPNKNIPNCIICDPQIDKNNPDFDGSELAGCGVIWHVCREIERKLNLDHSMTNELTINMAIGTIADMVPMTFINMGLARYGLWKLNNSNTESIYNKYKKLNGITSLVSRDISWTLAPQINACGKSNKIEKGAKFFHFDATKNENQTEIISEIIKISEKLKSESKQIKAIIADAVENGDFNNHNICIFYHEKNTDGLAGVLASYLESLTGKPSIVLAKKSGSNNELIGSGRCNVNKLSILELLKHEEKNGTIKYADGHAMACGVCFYIDKLSEIQKNLDNRIQKLLDDGSISLTQINRIDIDSSVNTDEATNDQIYQILNCIPYGKKFEEPIFCIENADIISVKSSKNNPNNICYTIKSEGCKKAISIWAWNIKPAEYDPIKHKKMSVVGNIVRNFQNPTATTFSIIDLKFN